MKKILLLIIILCASINVTAQVIEDDNRRDTPIILPIYDLQNKSDLDLYNALIGQLKNNKKSDTFKSLIEKDNITLYPVWLKGIPFSVIFRISDKKTILEDEAVILNSEAKDTSMTQENYTYLYRVMTSNNGIKSYTNPDGRKEMICFPFADQGRVIYIYVREPRCITIIVDPFELSQKEIAMYDYIYNHQLDTDPVVKSTIENYNTIFKNRANSNLNSK